LREFGGRAVVIREDYTVFETTGQDKEINKLLAELDKYGLIEYVKSSRIAIIKNSEGLHKKVMEMEKNHPIPEHIRNEFLSKKSMIFDV
jgi:acetolactate synthase-1/3 small subunit